ncbi:hypothetical protein SynBIOSE41_01228 [Synechococcus sp. BIOS-E4-1]|nr:hypothetical protein SynBIOSE41_01228 [Synechococcus sp. BIOS-E4-1]
MTHSDQERIAHETSRRLNVSAPVLITAHDFDQGMFVTQGS